MSIVQRVRRPGSIPSLFGVVVVALLALSAPAHALLCGDGIVDTLLFEECDDGNNLPGDCCTPLCQLVTAGTSCRAAAGVCDAEEVCDGASGFCPVDVRVPAATSCRGAADACDVEELCDGTNVACPADARLPDGDADGVCDAIDHCPAIADPANQDGDADGLGDACDPCTNPEKNPILKAKLSFAKLGMPLGDDRVRIKGGAIVPGNPPLDPIGNGLRVLVEDGNGTPAIDAMIPAGPFDPRERAGWKVNPQGTVFSYRARDGAAEANGIQRIVLKQKLGFTPDDPAAVRFVIVGRSGTYPGPEAAPVTVTLILDPPHAANGQCAEGRFNESEEGGPRCVYLNNGNRFICR